MSTKVMLTQHSIVRTEQRFFWKFSAAKQEGYTGKLKSWLAETFEQALAESKQVAQVGIAGNSNNTFIKACDFGGIRFVYEASAIPRLMTVVVPVASKPLRMGKAKRMDVPSKSLKFAIPLPKASRKQHHRFKDALYNKNAQHLKT